MSLTQPQTAVLAYFKAIADGRPRKRVNLDPRTLKALRERGLLEFAAGLYGGSHRITPAGLVALKQ